MIVYKRGKNTWYKFKAKDFDLLEQALYDQKFRKVVHDENNKKV